MRYSLLLLFLAAPSSGLSAAAVEMPELFGVYLNAGEAFLRLEPHPAVNTAVVLGSHELRNVRPAAITTGEFEFLVHGGGATELMQLPLRRLERVRWEVDAESSGSRQSLKNVWFAHPSEITVRLAPVAERPGMVRGKPTRVVPAGYWALELREILFPFSVGNRPEQAAGCLVRRTAGGYEPCRPPSVPPRERQNALSAAAAALFGLDRTLTGYIWFGAAALWGLGWRMIGDVWDNAIVQSTAVLFAMLALYGVGYWSWLRRTRSFVLEVAPFRVWGGKAADYPADGLAACVVDELQRLQLEIREHGKFDGLRRGGLDFHEIDVPPPAPAQVTIEFKGMSLERLNGFLRRLFGRHTSITGDLLPNESTVRLLGRAAGAAPWEVEKLKQDDGADLRHALREFAVRAVVAVRPEPESRAALANALAFKQAQAFAANEDEEALRIADLGLIALPNEARQLFNRGVAYQKLNRHKDAVKDYTAALARDPDKVTAYRNRAIAYDELSETELARKDLLVAQRLDPKDEKLAAVSQAVSEAEESTESKLERR